MLIDPHSGHAVAKCITVYVKPGHMRAYLAAQAVWNRETRRSAGYLGEFVGRDPQATDVIHVHLYWRSRDDLVRFMADDHDRIAALSNADGHCERIEVRILDEAT